MTTRRILVKLIMGIVCMAALAQSVAAPAVPDARARALHVLNRLAYGPRPGDVEAVMKMGVERYIDEQLDPQEIVLPDSLKSRLAVLDAANRPASEVLADFLEARKEAKADGDEGKEKRREVVKEIGEQTAQARLARALESPRQLEEVMTDFWFNHFNVYAGKGLDRALIASYERDAIRPYALGRFRDLLGATAHHPAMLFYLDNWLSAAPGYEPARRPKSAQSTIPVPGGLNENYARELMELHTLGVDGGYTQKDVTELARMLTGWTFEPRRLARGGDGFHFDRRRHDQGDKEWLGRHVFPRGQAEGEWALDVLADHPATARHIAYELAQYFVADRPPAALVDRMERRFLDTKGDIRAVLRTLFDSPEFWAPESVGNKFKTPYQYVVSAARAAGVRVGNVHPLLGALNQLGMPLYGCQTPDGYKNTEEAWLNPDALTRRINFATALATGRLPLEAPAVAESGMQMAGMSEAAPRAGIRGEPVDADALLSLLGGSISAHTRETITANPPALGAALLLGSPDFMRH